MRLDRATTRRIKSVHGPGARGSYSTNLILGGASRSIRTYVIGSDRRKREVGKSEVEL